MCSFGLRRASLHKRCSFFYLLEKKMCESEINSNFGVIFDRTILNVFRFACLAFRKCNILKQLVI